MRAFYYFKIMPSYAFARIFAHFNCYYFKNKTRSSVVLNMKKNMQKFSCQSEFMSLSYSENRNAIFFFVFCSHSAQFCAFWPKICSTPRFRTKITEKWEWAGGTPLKCTKKPVNLNICPFYDFFTLVTFL